MFENFVWYLLSPCFPVCLFLRFIMNCCVPKRILLCHQSFAILTGRLKNSGLLSHKQQSRLTVIADELLGSARVYFCIAEP